MLKPLRKLEDLPVSPPPARPKIGRPPSLPPVEAPPPAPARSRALNRAALAAGVLALFGGAGFLLAHLLKDREEMQAAPPIPSLSALSSLNVQTQEGTLVGALARIEGAEEEAENASPIDNRDRQRLLSILSKD